MRRASPRDKSRGESRIAAPATDEIARGSPRCAKSRGARAEPTRGASVQPGHRRRPTPRRSNFMDRRRLRCERRAGRVSAV